MVFLYIYPAKEKGSSVFRILWWNILGKAVDTSVKDRLKYNLSINSKKKMHTEKNSLKYH